jgi:hypothetical protein
MQDNASSLDVHAPCMTIAADSKGIGTSPLWRDFRALAAIGGVGFLAVVVISAGILIKPPTASAVPSFARQTGQPCATCHTAFPELTPFGRRFELGGYTMGGGLTFEEAPPIAAMVIPTFTHTARNQDTPPASGTHTNNNTVMQQASIFYGGTVYGNVGGRCPA